jgi:hypothetical protein
MLLYLILLLFLFQSSSSSSSHEDCISLGFISSSLLCESCDVLLQTTQDDALFNECTKCCSSSSTLEDQIYEKARLEYSPYTIDRFPHISAFIDRHAQDYVPKLEFARKQNVAKPFLVMIKQGGEEKEMHIASWKTEHLIEFLNEKLRSI